ncbi:MAG: AAA family ATPase [Lyngbya sp.]|nr:AAA family ATPase [Lyngbya sp.]
MTLGITVGKFYPFHLGHDYLIRTAKSQVNHLIVLLGYKPNEKPSGTIRASWIRQMHPDVEVIEVLDNLPEAPEPWALKALELLGGRQPNFAFTSELYGEPWAIAMGAIPVTIDLHRQHFPISGSQLRENLATHWLMLTPPAKAYFAQRICILGVESSGTTTLAKALAEYYQTVWVPEYGRTYWEGRQFSPHPEQWHRDEFLHIAQTQIMIEDNLALRANKLIICDTDPLATTVWHRRYLGVDCPALVSLAQHRNYELYILTEPDFEFVQDGTRESESLRIQMHQWFIERLTQMGKPWVSVAGSPEKRLADVISRINSIQKPGFSQKPGCSESSR